MDLPVIGPSNRFLIPQRDRHWPQVLSALIGVSALVVLALALVGWPRLRSTSIHYELIRLRAQVAELEQRERILLLELEHERSPERLAARASELGMVPAAPLGLPAQAPLEVAQ
ncbi:MAG: hypothetical protein OQK55_05245 [Thermoanaerobaculales bacterium]|nr:hypothetical protein [Thermoanaerobaculales bacterium]